MPVIPPESVSGLKAWTPNFSAKLSATPTIVGCTAAMATAYAGLSTDFLARVAINENPATRTKVTIEDQHTSKSALLAKARELCKIINAYPGTTNSMRVDFGLKIRDNVPTPIPAPGTRPALIVESNGVVTIHDESTPTRKGRPAGVKGAVILSLIQSATLPAPTSADEARFNRIATRSRVALALPEDADTKKLYVFSQWFNERGELGPVSLMASTTIAA